MSMPEAALEGQLSGLPSGSGASASEIKDLSSSQPRRKRKFILWSILAVFLSIAIVLAIVLGIILTRQHQMSQNAPPGPEILPANRKDVIHVSTKKIGNLTALSEYAALIPMKDIDGDMYSDTSIPSRTFVMGDVHGCIDELNALVDAIQYDYDAGDRIILAGDIVAKGPDSIGVLRRAKELKVWCVRGNHDDKVVRLATYVRQVPVEQRKQEIPEGHVYDPLLLDDEHMTIVNNMTDDDYNFLKSCPMMLGIPSIESLFVHAGINPNVPLKQQEPYFVMNIRSMTADGQPVKKASDGEYPWSDVWNNLQRSGSNSSIYRKIYYGHASARGLDLKEYSFGLDTGCVYGGNLTALEINSGKITQVSCRPYVAR